VEFRIADTFTDSLAKLTNQEQKTVKTTAFDLQLNPANPGLRFHKLDRTKDPNFWSISVNMDIRLIIHKTAASLMLCYVDHHDNAYAWASRRKIERHPKTGAAQLVEIRERVEEVIIPQTPPVPQTQLFDQTTDDDLLGYGVPPEWLDDVRLATEQTLLDLVDHLPQEAGEALLELATGGTPQTPTTIPTDTDSFQHPDAQRRFRVMTNQAELERALAYPWEKWTVFLHPAQRSLVEREYNGPARISGSAGTGKTIVALHRAVFLARHYPQTRILLTTFSEALAQALQLKLTRLVGNETEISNRIVVCSIQRIAYELYTEVFEEPRLIEPDEMRSQLMAAAANVSGHHFTESFLMGEWQDVVDAWQLKTWNAYRDVHRLGRKTRIGGKQRELFWAIAHQAQTTLKQQNLLTWPSLFQDLTEHWVTLQDSPFDFVVVDEAQDMGISELRLLAALGQKHPDSLFFTGDLGQRIFQQPFSWKALGIDIRGRSQTLTINYRTSHQIRQQADRLLPSAVTDVDGNIEYRNQTVSVFNGSDPELKLCDDVESEIAAVGTWIVARLQSGLQPDEIGVFVRDIPQLTRAIAAIKGTGLSPCQLTNLIASQPGAIAVSTMHFAKGLEFRAVAVMACDDEVLPLQARIEHIADEADLEEVYNTERHLLYVACTRARDHLLITGVDPASEFLDDLAD